MSLSKERDLVCILIPAYNPDKSLVELVSRLVAEFDILAVIVIDDGSTGPSVGIFSELPVSPKLVLLKHAVNLGKGRALKTGLNYFLGHFPHCAGIVTADADGQHLFSDILKICRKLEKDPHRMILGVREFSSKTIPWRSRFGNAVTQRVFSWLSNQNIRDAQTGLRGIPTHLVGSLLSLRGERYEFEMEQLVRVKRLGLVIDQIPIETVYFPGNPTSHFNPLFDSMRIYFLLLRFMTSSLLASVIDMMFFMILMASGVNLIISMLLGRYFVGLALNFFINNRFVFLLDRFRWLTFLKYAIFATILGIISAGLVEFLKDQGNPVLTAKIIVETTLFAFSFTIQRNLIFSPRGDTDEDRLG
jgi:glycosyltransferase involved in cell wall biosynthesis